MSDERNKRLLKNIFGYYPAFDPITMKKIPPRTPEEKIDSHFSYLDYEKRKSIKAMISDPEKVLERAKNLDKIIKIRVKQTGKGENTIKLNGSRLLMTAFMIILPTILLRMLKYY